MTDIACRHAVLAPALANNQARFDINLIAAQRRNLLLARNVRR